MQPPGDAGPIILPIIFVHARRQPFPVSPAARRVIPQVVPSAPSGPYPVQSSVRWNHFRCAGRGRGGPVWMVSGIRRDAGGAKCK